MKYVKQLITVLVLFLITLSGASADQYSNKPIHWGIKRVNGRKTARSRKSVGRFAC